jgi:hypothetical protein
MNTLNTLRIFFDCQLMKSQLDQYTFTAEFLNWIQLSKETNKQ